jgi:excisionase family DNA binding protein
MARDRPILASPAADLTPVQVAAELQVNVSSVYKLIHDGVLPAYHPLGRGSDTRPARRGLRVTRADLDQHKARNVYEAREPVPVPGPRRRARVANHPAHQQAMAYLAARGLA